MTAERPPANEDYVSDEFDRLDLDGKVRKLNKEISYLKDQVENYRTLTRAVLRAFAMISEGQVGPKAELAIKMREAAAVFDQARRHHDPDFYRKPK